GTDRNCPPYYGRHIFGAVWLVQGANTAVKIDVEGHENSVLRGMREMLRTHRPRIVMFEYLQRTNLKETFDIFGSVDYRIIVLSSRGEPSFATPDVAPLQDLFACPCQQAC